MGKKNEKSAYALSVVVKPAAVVGVRYRALIFKGIALACNPTKAKELAVDIVLKSFEDYDGSAITRPVITRENIVVKKCELFGDFITKDKGL